MATADSSKPPEEEQPKDLKKALLKAGALAGVGLTAFLALSGKQGHEPKDVQDDTKTKVTHVTAADAGIAKRLKQIQDKNRERESVSINDIAKDPALALRLMKNGDMAGAEIIINGIHNRIYSSRYDARKKVERLEDVLAELGISENEYNAAANAVEIERCRGEIEAAESPGELDEGIMGRLGPIHELWHALVRQSIDGNSPFDPLFLQLLGMNKQQLQDLLQETIELRKRARYGPNDDYLRPSAGEIAAIKRAYEIQ